MIVICPLSISLLGIPSRIFLVKAQIALRSLRLCNGNGENIFSWTVILGITFSPLHTYVCDMPYSWSIHWDISTGHVKKYITPVYVLLTFSAFTCTVWTEIPSQNLRMHAKVQVQWTAILRLRELPFLAGLPNHWNGEKMARTFICKLS